MPDNKRGRPPKTIVDACRDITGGNVTNKRKALNNIIDRINTESPLPPECMESAYVLAATFKKEKVDDFFFVSDVLIQAIDSLVRKGTTSFRPAGERWRNLCSGLVDIESGKKNTLGEDNGFAMTAVKNLLGYLSGKSFTQSPDLTKKEQVPSTPPDSSASKPPAKPPAPPATPKTVIHGQGELVRICGEISEFYRAGVSGKTIQAIQDRLNAVYDYAGYPQDPKARKSVKRILEAYDGLAPEAKKRIDENKKTIQVPAISSLLNAFRNGKLEEAAPYPVAFLILDAAAMMVQEASVESVFDHLSHGQDSFGRTVLQGLINNTDPRKHPELLEFHSGLLDLSRSWQDRKGNVFASVEFKGLLASLPAGSTLDIELVRVHYVSRVYDFGSGQDELQGPHRPSRQRTPRLGGPSPAPGGGKKR